MAVLAAEYLPTCFVSVEPWRVAPLIPRVLLTADILLKQCRFLLAGPWQAVSNPSFVSSLVGVRVQERSEYLGYVIKLYTWHRDPVIMHDSHLLAFPGHCPSPGPMD